MSKNLIKIPKLTENVSLTKNICRLFLAHANKTKIKKKKYIHKDETKRKNERKAKEVESEYMYGVASHLFTIQTWNSFDVGNEIEICMLDCCISLGLCGRSRLISRRNAALRSYFGDSLEGGKSLRADDFFVVSAKLFLFHSSWSRWTAKMRRI